MLINGVAKEYFMNVVNKVRYVCLIKWSISYFSSVNKVPPLSKFSL